MITSTLWKTLFTYPTLREKQAGNPREETTPLLPKFYHYRDNTFPRRIFSQGSLLLHCISSSSPFDDNEEKDTRRNDRPPLPPLLLYAVSPEAARAPNILFGRQQYPRRAIVGGAGNGVVCSMADLPLV